MRNNDNDLKRNKSGYPDPTAYEAIMHLNTQTKPVDRFYKLLDAIYIMCDVAGFTIKDPIVLEDKETKKIYK
jgi:hypothetical protein